MTFETTYSPEDEQVTIVLEDSAVLKATLGAKREVKLNEKFRELENDNYELYLILHRMTKDLLKLIDI